MRVRLNLTKEQIAFLNDPHPVKLLIAGRQWGKSHTLEAGLVKTCGTTLGRSAVVMPIQSMANQFFRAMMDGENFAETLLKEEPKLWPFPAMVFRNGHYLEWRSFENPKRLRGGKWTGLVCCDEANDLEGEEITRIILPKVSVTKAQVLITTTITHWNWILDLYHRGQTNDPVVKSWMYPSPTGIMFQGDEGKKRLADLKSITPQHIFDSEFLCQVGHDDTQAFPYFDKFCLTDARPPEQPQPGRQYVAGLDLGRTRDHCFLVIIDDQGLVVVAKEFPLQLHDVTAQQVAALARVWRCKVVVDSTSKGGAGGRLGHDDDSYIVIYQKYIPGLVPFCFSANRDNQTKGDLVSNLCLSTEQKRILCWRGHDELIAQMRTYHILQNRGGYSTYGPKKGERQKDDAVAGLLLSDWGRKNRWWFAPANPNLTPFSR